MTLNANDVRNEYTATASQTIFNYTFKIYNSTDLDVYVTPVGKACSISDLTTSYSVAGVGAEGGGSITLTTPTTSGDLVTIVSSIPSSRTTDYLDNGDFRPDTVNYDFDRTLSITKQANDRVNRTLAFPDCEQSVSGKTLPSPIANNFLRWKSDLTGMENFTFSTSGLTAEVSVDDYAALRALTSATYTDGQVIIVTDDGVWGMFVIKTGSVTDNAGTKIVFTDDSNRYAERVYDGAVNVKWFGAIGNGVANDAAAFVAAQTESSDGYILIPNGTFSIDTDLTINENTTLVFKGGKIQLEATKTILMYGSVEAGTYDHIFTITDYETNIRWLNGQDLLVTWYGAAGDNDSANATVNHLAVQVAIYSFQNKNSSSVEQETRPYGVVRIPRGRYVWNESVWQSNTSGTLDPNSYGENIRGVSIVGDGFASTRIAYSDTTNTSIQGMFRLAGTLAAKVSDLYLSSNADFGTFPNSTENKVAIRFDKGGNEVFFQNIRIQQYERGYRLNSIKDCFMTDCTVDGCVRYGLEVENNASVHLANCDLFRNDLGTDFLTTNSYPDTDKHGVIGLIDDSNTANFVMLVNCHLGLGSTNANIIYSEGVVDGVYMNNCRAVDDDGSGEFNIKGKDTNFYVDNCDFTDFGLNLIRCGGHFSNSTLGKCKLWDPGNKDSTGVDILKLHNITFRESSTISEAWVQVNVGNDYESNPGTEGKIELHDSNNIIKTTNNFCTIQEVEYASVKDNYLWNVDGAAGIFIDSDVTNAQMVVQGNIIGELSVPTNGINVMGDNTHLAIITGNEVSNSSSTGVSISGTNSGSWVNANNLDTTVI